MKETKELGTKPVGQLIARFSVPAVIAMMVNAIYNVVDRIFIGKLVGEGALAGLTIAFPIMMIIFAFAGLIGIGGATLLSIRLGEKDYKGASRVFGNTITFGMAVVGLIVAALFYSLDSVLVFFGASDQVLLYAGDYMSIILLGFIFQMLSFILSNFVRTEGKPQLSMVAMIASALTNIILDYVFIAHMDMGVRGAALGTILGQLLGLGIYLNYYFRGRSNIRLSVKDFALDIELILKILGIGFTTFISTIGTSAAFTFLNLKLSEYGGTAGVTSMGAINSLFTLFIMPIMGITQGIQPIIGYNFGAKQMNRVYETLRSGIIVASVFSVVVFIMLELFASTFIMMFLQEGSETVDMATYGLRIFIAMLPILSISLIGTAFFQSVAKAKMSLFLGMLRQFIFLLPLLFILPNTFGITGVWLATPIADALSVLVTLIFLMRNYRMDKAESGKMLKQQLALEDV